MKKAMILFTILQEGFEYSVELKTSGGKDEKEAALKQIQARLNHLLLLRKQTGSDLGLKLNKPVGFRFKLGTKTVDTLTIAEKLNVMVKIGNKSNRRKKFFNTTAALIEFAMRGNKAYTNKEIKALENELDTIVAKDSAATKATKDLAEQEVVSN